MSTSKRQLELCFTEYGIRFLSKDPVLEEVFQASDDVRKYKETCRHAILVFSVIGISCFFCPKSDAVVYPLTALLCIAFNEQVNLWMAKKQYIRLAAAFKHSQEAGMFRK